MNFFSFFSPVADHSQCAYVIRMMSQMTDLENLLVASLQEQTVLAMMACLGMECFLETLETYLLMADKMGMVDGTLKKEGSELQLVMWFGGD